MSPHLESKYRQPPQVMRLAEDGLQLNFFRSRWRSLDGRSQGQVRQLLWVICGSVLLFSSLLTVAMVLTKSPAVHQRVLLPNDGDCGGTPSLALAKGCEFDMLSYSWTPQSCLDRQTSDDFRDWLMNDTRETGPWPFFTDAKGRQRVSNELSLSMKTDAIVWTTREAEMGRCVFLMRRIHRAATADVVIAPGLGDSAAPLSCTQEVLRGIVDPSFYRGRDREHDRLDTSVKIAFESC